MTTQLGAGDVAVVIPVRNGARFLAEAIESVYAQTIGRPDLVVVDDGSADGSGDIAAAMGARCLRRAPQGLSAARNAGVATTLTPLIAFLDSDDRWLPNKLERQIEVLNSEPSLGFVTTMARIVVEPGVPRPQWTPALNDGDLLPEALGSTLLVRRDVLEKVGGFDPEFLGSGDFDWRLRANDAGIPNRQLPEALIEYRLHGSNMSNDRRALLDGSLDALPRRCGGAERSIGTRATSIQAALEEIDVGARLGTPVCEAVGVHPPGHEDLVENLDNRVGLHKPGEPLELFGPGREPFV